jgi:hypothetical protein
VKINLTDRNERKTDRMIDDRDRPYNNVLGFGVKAPTMPQMEAFYRKRKREDDLMAKFL